MRDRFPLLAIGALALLGVLGSFLFRGAARGAFADRLSTYRSEPDGARALYLLAEESGLPISRHQQNLEVLEDGVSLVLLAIEPAEERDGADGGTEEEEEEAKGLSYFLAGGLTEDEREKLLEHVQEGHTLIYVPGGARRNPLLGALGVEHFSPDPELEIRTLVPAQPTPFTLGVERVEARVQSFLHPPEHAVPLLVDDRLGEVVAALIPHGQGQVIVVGAPELAMNQALGRADNARFWLSLLHAAAGRGTIAFDEFHHGFTGDRSIAEFAGRYGLHFAAAQLLLGIALWAAALRRFGRPKPPPEDTRVGSTDALFATSRLYREGRHHAYAAQLIARGLVSDLAGHAGLRWTAAPSEVAEALKARGRHDAASALYAVNGLAASASSESDVLKLARQAAAARALVLTSKRSHR